MKDLILSLHDEFTELLEESRSLCRRLDVRFPDIPNKIKVAIGMRRSGKTSLLMQQIHDLLEQGVELTQILYVNFEDDRLLPMSQEALAELIDVFYELHPENYDSVCYIFLDEIQNVEEWPLVVRRINDTKRVQIYLTGSSAKLLSKEIATSLRGRSVAIEVWPFSFYEYLTMRDISLPDLPQTMKQQHQNGALLNDYLNTGGFPEVVLLQEEDRVRILRDYVSVVLLRDIVERHNIGNIALIRYMIKTLLKNNACTFAVNKFFNDLKSQGFSIGRGTVYDYLEYIEDAYMVFKVPLFNESERKVQSNPKKIYAIDSGLVKAFTFSFSENFGRMFENLVYLDLRRKEYEVFYYLTSDRYEVDFLTRSLTGEIKLYQVVWDMSDQDVMDREVRALEAAQSELGYDGAIITPKNYIEFLRGDI